MRGGGSRARSRVGRWGTGRRRRTGSRPWTLSRWSAKSARSTGPHVDKAFDLAEGGWSLALRARGEGRRELILVPGRYAALIPFGSERSEELSPFARELRRLLTGASFDRVSEPAGERFLEVALTRGDTSSELLLSLEMFGTGNLTVALGGKIAAVAFTRRWAHRLVRVGAEYVRPPSRADPWGLSEMEIEEILTRSRTSLTSTLAARMGLGGPLAEELVARMKVDGAEPSTAAPADRARALRTVLAELRGELGDRRPGSSTPARAYCSMRRPTRPNVGPGWRGSGKNDGPRFRKPPASSSERSSRSLRVPARRRSAPSARRSSGCSSSRPGRSRS